MAALGGMNPWPLEWGGGPSEEEVIYGAMRSAVGVGGSAPNENGIDGLWRQCRAAGLAAGGCAVERAVMQAFPQKATDHIPVWEEILGVVPSEDATDEDRRRAIVEAYTAQVAGSEIELSVALAEIDSRLAPVVIPRALTSFVELGKAFEPQDGLPVYGGGGRKSTAAPNYSSDFYVPVQLTIGTTMPTQVDVTSITRAKRLLKANLGSWVDYAVFTNLGPFLADVSPLDFTCSS